MSDVDPAALIASDLLVLEALTRAWARTVKRSGRSTPAAARHNQYMRAVVPEDRIDAVMHDAWVLCPLLAQRHHLLLDPQKWADTLDGYTRALLLMGMAHSPQRLVELLAPLQQEADHDEATSSYAIGGTLKPGATTVRNNTGRDEHVATDDGDG